MKKYQWILFDADETLFDFPSFVGLQNTLKPYGIELTEAEFADYEAINQSLWADYQQQKVDMQILKTKRFEMFSQRIGISPLQLNDEFGEQMAKLSKPLLDTIETLRNLCSHHQLAIITNGCIAMQPLRLENTQTADFFQFILSSEEAGIAKPHAGIFEQAFMKMQQLQPVEKSQVLMVGDSLSSDILGGNNFGFDTCWLNRHNFEPKADIQPTFTITRLGELTQFIKD